MAAGGARHGRRDNGLHAAEYAAVADVDPRIGEHLLDVLAAGGIAAYLQPASDLNPVTRTTTVPSRPTDRLYVDRAHLQIARDYLSRLAEGDDGGASATADIDAEWDRLVASYHADVDPQARPWPAAEQVDFRPGQLSGASQEPSRPPEHAPGRAASPGDEPSLLDALDTFGAGLPDDGPEAEERYVPPPPPPLPRISKYAAAGIFAIVAGFGLFVFPTLLPLSTNVSMLLGFLAILGGFVTLIWRLRPGNSDDEDDPDDGAVV